MTRMVHLETRLRSSASSLSISSSSSLGSLSSHASSLSSLSFTDIYGLPQYTDPAGGGGGGGGAGGVGGGSGVDMVDLQRRVERLLHASDGELPPASLSPRSSLESVSPPVSPFEAAPPPAYEPCDEPAAAGGGGGPEPPLSPILEAELDPAGGADRSVSAAVSNESVAGDSGVFEACSRRLLASLETAQLQVRLRYALADGVLYVGIERARNLAALSVPDGLAV